MKQTARLSHQQYFELASYLKNRAHEGVIPERIGPITAEAARVMGIKISPSAVRSVCKSNGIELEWNIPASQRNGANAAVAPNLDARLQQIEVKIDLIIAELGVKIWSPS